LAEFPGAYEPAVQRQPLRRQRGARAVETAPAGADVQRPGDGADPLVAEIEEIIGRLIGGGEIVDRHRIEAVALETAAEQDCRHATAGRLARGVGRRVADGNE